MQQHEKKGHILSILYLIANVFNNAKIRYWLLRQPMFKNMNLSKKDDSRCIKYSQSIGRKVKLQQKMIAFYFNSHIDYI